MYLYVSGCMYDVVLCDAITGPGVYDNAAS